MWEEEERLKSDGRATDGDNYIIFRIPTVRKSRLINRSAIPSLPLVFLFPHCEASAQCRASSLTLGERTKERERAGGNGRDSARTEASPDPRPLSSPPVAAHLHQSLAVAPSRRNVL